MEVFIMPYKDPEVHKQKCAERYQANKERYKKRNEEWRQKNLERVAFNNWTKNIKRYFGITPEDYELIYNNQEGCCAICKKHSSTFRIRLAVDHDHDTGEVRGLLCDRCNRGIGMLKDSPEICRQAAQYIEERKR